MSSTIGSMNLLSKYMKHLKTVWSKFFFRFSVKTSTFCLKRSQWQNSQKKIAPNLLASQNFVSFAELFFSASLLWFSTILCFPLINFDSSPLFKVFTMSISLIFLFLFYSISISESLHLFCWIHFNKVWPTVCPATFSAFHNFLKKWILSTSFIGLLL